MKVYSTFLRSPELEPHHQKQFSVILRTRVCVGEVSYHSMKATFSIFYPQREKKLFSASKLIEFEPNVNSNRKLKKKKKKKKGNLNFQFFFLPKKNKNKKKQQKKQTNNKTK